MGYINGWMAKYMRVGGLKVNKYFKIFFIFPAWKRKIYLSKPGSKVYSV